MEPKSLLICQLFLTGPFYNFHILILILILHFLIIILILHFLILILILHFLILILILILHFLNDPFYNGRVRSFQLHIVWLATLISGGFWWFLVFLQNTLWVSEFCTEYFLSFWISQNHIEDLDRVQLVHSQGIRIYPVKQFDAYKRTWIPMCIFLTGGGSLQSMLVNDSANLVAMSGDVKLGLGCW